MRDVMLSYFAGEKQAALILIAAGAAALGSAAVMFSPRFELRPLALTLGVFALLFLAVGGGLSLRTDPQVEKLTAQLGSDPDAFFVAEAARMTRVQRSFVVIQYAEVVLIILSAVLAVALKHRPVVVGVAMGVAIGASFLLAFDLVAERRGATYLAALTRR